ncbi:MAG: D-alanyl-D-alanine carboxypeptidase, partial [Clostridiales bacterium]|nr:D-alanyl-D-alanine carboxypeptidase [Clostridiales bacterium]
MIAITAIATTIAAPAVWAGGAAANDSGAEATGADGADLGGETAENSDSEGADAGAAEAFTPSAISPADDLSFRPAVSLDASENDVSVSPEPNSQSLFDTSGLPEFEAEAYILIDRRTGQTICAKNPDKKMYPASTTKIMTGILALEMGDLNSVMTASAKAIRDIGPDGSNIGLIAGEKMRLDNLLDALLVKSANETGNIIAENLCDTRDEFIALMNAKARELGAVNTHFSNTSGYQEESHYTTAYDLSRIANYAMNNAKFREYVAKRSIILSPTNKHASWDRMNTTNSLLSDDSIKGFAITGIKTGYHSESGYCLVASGVDSGGMELLCVVLGVYGTVPGTSAKRFKIASDLLAYGFENFKVNTFIRDQELVGTISVLGGESLDTVDAISDGTVKLFLPVDQEKWDISRIEYVKSEITAPVSRGAALGYVEFRSGGNFAGRVNVVAASDISAAKGGARQTLKRSDTGSAKSAVSLSGGAIEGPKASGGQGTGAVSGDSGATGGGSGANGGLSADETAGAPSDEESAAAATGDADTDDGGGADGETDAAAGPFASIPGTIGKIALICLISLAALISILRTIRAIRTNK